MAWGGDRVRPTGPSLSGDVIAGILPPSRAPCHSAGFLARTLPSILPQEDARSWEIPPPAIRGSHHTYFVHIFGLAYIIIILLACSKSVTIKICAKKYEKNARTCETPDTVDPAKRGLKRTRVEPAMLDFVENRRYP